MTSQERVRGLIQALGTLVMPPLPLPQTWTKLLEDWGVGEDEQLLIQDYLSKTVKRIDAYLGRRMYDEALILLERVRKVAWNQETLLHEMEDRLKGLSPKNTGEDLLEWKTLLDEHLRILKKSGQSVFIALSPQKPSAPQEKKGFKWKPLIPWLVIIFSLVLSIPVLNLVAFLTNQRPLRDALLSVSGTPEITLPLALTVPEGLEVTADIQRSQLLLNPDAPLFVFKARLNFPKQEMKEVTVHVKLLDDENRVLWDKEIELLSSDEPLLRSDQSLEMALRTALGPWGSFLNKVQISITKALATDSPTSPPTPLAVQFTQQPPQGIQPQFALMQSLWSENFASLNQTLDLEVTNQGLKSLGAFDIRVDWLKDGTFLESKEMRVLKNSQPALGPGNRMRFRFKGDISREMYSLKNATEIDYRVNITHIQTEESP